jgi:hypothetical protein
MVRAPGGEPAVTTRSDRPSAILGRPDFGRRVFGFFLAFGIKAYGTAAAVAVALSDAETVSEKGDAAINAVPSLLDEYRDAKYVFEHREEIQTAVDYVNENAPDRSELQRAAEESTETLAGIGSTYDDVLRAREALTDDLNPLDAAGPLRDAWEGRPELSSIQDLAEMAGQVSPFVDQVQVLIPVFYGGVLTVMDNFASDELGGTLGVIGAALVLAWILGTAVGFWARRGRPGLVAYILQGWGAHLFRDWYVRHLEYALGRPLYLAVRERVQRDVVADPEGALDPEGFQELERYFERRLGERVRR